MPRIVLISLLVLLAPTLIYLAAAYIIKGGENAGGILSRAPLLTLFTLGFLLMIGSLAYFIELERRGTPGQKYYPPAFKDGVLTPGRSE
ncbi:MAG: hypothetical protein SGJ17_13405 [Hyphomicrobiales bacterium]|nr:hypothetical protein [Hyphomicrobiales bacterium]MDZ4792181.1 hypothetical protein [Hyphomicrobiales bacterium]